MDDQSVIQRSRSLVFYDSDFAAPPGALLGEHMEATGLTVTEIARISGLSFDAVLSVLNASEVIVAKTAEQLQAATEIPAQLWMVLERQYREHLQYREDLRRI